MTVNVVSTELTYSALPLGHPEFGTWAVRVTWRGGENYAVKFLSQVLNRDGKWEYEPIPSERGDDFIERTRFDYLTAQRLAVEHAPKIRINGMTADEVARRFPTEETP